METLELRERITHAFLAGRKAGVAFKRMRDDEGILQLYLKENLPKDSGQEIELSRGQNLFEALQDVCGFIALESDMDEIIRAVEKDNKQILKIDR
ncbi:hypothetical protein FGF1_03670 [Flavobacteriaceae bacterium GF1]